jgi:hypothetical protein
VDLPHQLFRRCTVLLRIESGGGYVLSHKPVASPVQPAEEVHFPSAQGTLAIDQDLERPSVHSHSPNSATVLSSTNLKIHDKFKPSPQAGHFTPGFQWLDRTLPRPPSTPRICPVIRQFRGSTNQEIADTTFAGSPILCKGCIAMLARSAVPLPVIRGVSGVFIGPGATQLTRMPKPA